MQLVVPHPLFGAVLALPNIRDVFSFGCPYDVITQRLHLAVKFLLACTARHTMIDSNTELYLPAVAVQGSAVFLGAGACRFGVGIVGIQYGKTVGLTDGIAERPQFSEEEFIVVQLHAAFQVVGTYDEMIVNVLPIDMGGDQNLSFAKPTGQLLADLVSLLRGDLFADLEQHVHGAHFFDVLLFHAVQPQNL